MRTTRKTAALILVGVLALSGVAFAQPTAPANIQAAREKIEKILMRGGFDVQRNHLPAELQQFLELVKEALAHLGAPGTVIRDMSHDTSTELKNMVVLVTVDSFDLTARTPYGWADFALDITTWTRNGAVYREKSLDFSGPVRGGYKDFSKNVTTQTVNGTTTVVSSSFDKSIDKDNDEDVDNAVGNGTDNNGDSEGDSGND
jgi:hypothetical protein